MCMKVSTKVSTMFIAIGAEEVLVTDIFATIFSTITEGIITII